jgi:DUF3047 family protein
MMDRFCTIIVLAVDNYIASYLASFVFQHKVTLPYAQGLRVAVSLALLGVYWAIPGCTHAPERKAPEKTLEVGRFSAAQPGGTFLDGWRPLILSRFKKATQYRLVSKDGVTVVAAHASSSASGLVHEVDIDVQRYPWLRWRWLVPAVIEQADNTRVTRSARVDRRDD